MEKCVFVKEIIEIPEVLIDCQADVFHDVIGLDTWNGLNEEQKNHLKTFLPSFTENDEEEKDKTINDLFTGLNFKFGNPLARFRKRLKDGLYTPDIAKYTALCKKAKHKEYRYQMQKYYTKLLKDVLISRQNVLDEVCHVPPGETIPVQHPVVPPKEKIIQDKVKKKYRSILREVRDECGVSETSSDDEDGHSGLHEPPYKNRKGGRGLGDADAQTVISTLTTKTAGGDLSASSCGFRGGVKITSEEYHELLSRHRKRRAEAEESLDLDTRHLDLQDIILRTQPHKKGTFKPSADEPLHRFFPEMQAEAIGQSMASMYSPPPAKKRLLKQKKKKLKKPSSFSPGSAGFMMGGFEGSMKGGLLEEDSLLDMQFGSQRIPSMVKTTYKECASFFSLLRDFICEQPELKITTVKLEENVREWQESPSSATNDWLGMQSNWVDLVLSALKFLSGDVLGLSIENFIPYVDYKERAQHWKWIGLGRDSDVDLAAVCDHWLHNKGSLPPDLLDGGQKSPPPPKVRTDFVMRPSSEEEKRKFRDQEKVRFGNPHRAYTYKLHGYTSVVGPVKGVYTRDSAMNKAREHALLSSERPAYVTILTLVRDAAARLPNGEGTRSDICELLKDSMFLADGVTDAQINTVVSGALDRLHYEKDPCVKYDVNRKIWIYLHRNRTEDEFEQIHQAQGAAAKAKKALQKPKSTKTPKSREVQSTERCSSSASLHSNESLSLDTSLASLNSPKGALHSPRGSQPSPRALPSSPSVSSPGVHSGQGLLASHIMGISSTTGKETSVGQSIASHGNITIRHQTSSGKPVILSQAAAQKPMAMQFLSSQFHQAKPESGQQGTPLTFGLVHSQGKTVSGTQTSPRVIMAPEMTLQRVAHTSSSQSPANSQHIVTSAVGPGGNPVVARIVQHQGAPLITGVRQQGPGPTIRIQGGNIIRGGKPFVHVPGTGQAGNIGGKPFVHVPGTGQAGNIPVSVVTHLGGKPRAQHTTSTSGQDASRTQLLQSLASSGIAVQMKDGKTHLVQSLGKPGQMTTKPTQLTALIGGKPTQIIGQHMISGKPQMVAKGPTAAALLAQLRSQAQGQQQQATATSVLSQVISSSQPVSTHAKSSSMILTPVSGQSQAGSAQAKSSSMILTPVSSGGHTKPGTTQKIMTLSQPGTSLPSQIMVQASDSSTMGKPSGNIQVMKTVLGQPGATLVWSQSNQPLTIAGDARQMKGKSSPGKNKPGPVYARIITPPPGIRLAAMLPGQQGNTQPVSIVHQQSAENTLKQQEPTTNSQEKS